ncbi:MAG: hypothetical protein FIB05_12780 [Betaproteobacteria bacterium]|nr:hypothetical protein [Betaproteobacteria bacterium]PWB58787.1 MAG: hypothetical protein C3F16_13185 [Betaproteobacteria bacterium]
MNAPLRYGLQAVLYAAFAATLGYFSTSPAFEPLPAGHALIRLSLNHAGQRKAACRVRSAEELAKLAPNMRAAEDCPRERAAVRVKVDLDGRSVADITAPPAGLSRDGASVAYRRIPVQAGTHRIRVALADDAAGTFDRLREEEVRLEPGRVLVIDFEPGKGGIVLR